MLVPVEIDETAAVFDQHFDETNSCPRHLPNDIVSAPLRRDHYGFYGVLQQKIAETNFLSCSRYEGADFCTVRIHDNRESLLVDGVLAHERSRLAGASPNRDRLASPMEVCKLSSDHLVRAWGRTYDLPVKITNCSNNYGPRQFPEKLIPLVLRNLLARKPLPIYGKGENVRDWLYVEDHVDAIWAVIERGAVGETYNVGGNEEQKNIDVVNALCRIVARETGADEEELLALRTFVADRPGHDQRYAIDATRIQRECGWSPRETFASGLEKTVRWYLAHPAWVRSVETGEYRTWMETNYAARVEGGRSVGERS